MKAWLYYLPPSSDVEKFNYIFNPYLCTFFFVQRDFKIFSLILVLWNFCGMSGFHLLCKVYGGSLKMNLMPFSSRKFSWIILLLNDLFPLTHHFLWAPVNWDMGIPVLNFFFPIFHLFVLLVFGGSYLALSLNLSIVFFLPCFPQELFLFPENFLKHFLFLFMRTITSLIFQRISIIVQKKFSCFLHCFHFQKVSSKLFLNIKNLKIKQECFYWF